MGMIIGLFVIVLLGILLVVIGAIVQATNKSKGTVKVPWYVQVGLLPITALIAYLVWKTPFDFGDNPEKLMENIAIKLVSFAILPLLPFVIARLYYTSKAKNSSMVEVSDLLMKTIRQVQPLIDEKVYTQNPDLLSTPGGGVKGLTDATDIVANYIEHEDYLRAASYIKYIQTELTLTYPPQAQKSLEEAITLLKLKDPKHYKEL